MPSTFGPVTLPWTLTRVPLVIASKVTSIVVSLRGFVHARRAPGSQTVMVPVTSSSSSYASTIRPPTPGSMRRSTRRHVLYASIGPSPHYWSNSSVNTVNAVIGSTSTTISEVMVVIASSLRRGA